MKTHLIQSRELFGPPDRQEELREVWQRNEGLFDCYTHPEGRPTFGELFRMCKPGMLNVIANADIYFDRSSISDFGRLMVYNTFEAGRHSVKSDVFALSRWDVDPTGVSMLWSHHDSQDTWIVYGGPHEVDAPYTMGVPGCDNALIHALQQAGFTVSNPSKSIRTYHLHLSNYRSYLDNGNGQGRGGAKLYRVPPPYAFVQPTEL